MFETTLVKGAKDAPSHLALLAKSWEEMKQFFEKEVQKIK